MHAKADITAWIDIALIQSQCLKQQKFLTSLPWYVLSATVRVDHASFFAHQYLFNYLNILSHFSHFIKMVNKQKNESIMNNV